MKNLLTSPLRSAFLIVLLSALTASCGPSIKTAGDSDHPNLRRFPDPRINLVIIKGWDNFQKGQYEWAALDFERLIKKDYIDDDICFGAAVSFFRQGDITRARRFCDSAMMLNPGHFEAIFLSAQINLRLGNRGAARDELRRLAGLSFGKPLICGLYFDENDIAGREKLEARKKEAASLTGE